MSIVSIPKILECSRLVAKSSLKSERIVRDYGLDFYVGGKRKMIIDGVEYPISIGSLVFTKPRQHIESYGDYNCYIMSLDLSGNVNIPPQQYLRNRFNGFQDETSHILLDECPTVFRPKHYEEILELFEVINTNTYPFPENTEVINKSLKALMLLISVDAISLNTVIGKKSANQDYVNRICNYINRNYREQILVKELARSVSINENYLIRIFKQKTKLTPNQYLNNVRLFHASQMLCESSITVSEISYSCGFNTPAYFTKLFKKRFGKTPSEFRRKSG